MFDVVNSNDGDRKTGRPLPAGPAGKEGESDKLVHANPIWQKLATHIQPKLAVSMPGDPCEQEADRVAERVLRMPEPVTQRAGAPGAAGQSSCPTCEQEPTLMRTSAGSAAPSTVPDDVASALGAGRPLEPSVREWVEPGFGVDFSRVRVHTDARATESARAVNARAYTLGQDVVFAAEQYAPATMTGKRLLAHELTHVVQNRGGAPASLARQTWGTSKTTAPPAKNESPGDVFRGKLKSEVALFENAAVILDWIVIQRTLAGGATVTSFTSSSLFSDAATTKKLKPPPATEADLLPTIAMLEYYGVVKSKGKDEWDIMLAPLKPGQTQQDVDRAKFDTARQDVSAFQKDFEKRFDAKGHPLQPIAEQELLEASMAAGSVGEKKAETDAETNLAATAAELDEFVAFRKKGKPIFRVTTDSPAKATAGPTTNVLLPIAGQTKPMAVDEADFDHIEAIRTGTSTEVEARRKAIEARVKGAERGLYDAQAFHRFATEMVWFLHQLDKGSPVKFKAGTYPRHGKFGEYAADMYPTINEDSRGFYSAGKAEQFVDEINKVAEAGHAVWGKFAWQIVYNDETLQATINAKYGPRMSSAPHHGPSPDKLHMHLDIRPLNVVADSATGYHVDASNRVVLD
jgi:Domain of unknown function (DUF4157)